MPVTIAVTGKGGTGKTTFCGILIKSMVENKKGRILAVDADPNSNLNEVLGIEIPISLGEIRERMLDRGNSGNSSQDDDAQPGNTVPPGMTKQDYLDYMFGDALIEETGFDMLVMGRTQGAGCYCYVNGILKTQLDRYSGGYSYIVADNEAGLEHISRGTLPHIDILLTISDCSYRGIQAAGRITALAAELNLKPKVSKLIVNRVPASGLGDRILKEIENQKLDLAGILPDDEFIYNYDSEGKPSADVPEDSPFKIAVRDIAYKLNIL